MNTRSGKFCDCQAPLNIDKDGVEFCSSMDCPFFDKAGAKKHWFKRNESQTGPKPKKKK